MAHYGDARQEEMFETVSYWVSEHGLAFVLRTLLDILRDLAGNL